MYSTVNSSSDMELETGRLLRHVAEMPGAQPSDDDLSPGAVMQSAPSRFSRAKPLILSAVAVTAVLAAGGYALGQAQGATSSTRARGDVAHLIADHASFSHAPASLPANPATAKAQMAVPDKPIEAIKAAAANQSAVAAAAAASLPVTNGPLPADAASPYPMDKNGVPINARRKPDLKPEEHLHDGNPCDDHEESLAGLCYTKCSILLGSPDACRFSAFSCCAHCDCHGNVFKMKTASLIPCHGFDKSTQDGGKACPHEFGECLEDEEQFMGECFEKCSTITDGKFPQRIGAASCCDPEGAGGCFNIMNDRTLPKLDVGGGAGDHDPSTPATPHYPMKDLTEQ